MKRTKPNRLTAALLETADDMRRVGVINGAEYDSIKRRHIGDQLALPDPKSDDEVTATGRSKSALRNS